MANDVTQGHDVRWTDDVATNIACTPKREAAHLQTHTTELRSASHPEHGLVCTCGYVVASAAVCVLSASACRPSDSSV